MHLKINIVYAYNEIGDEGAKYLGDVLYNIIQ